jgi:hypothetical protein
MLSIKAEIQKNLQYKVTTKNVLYGHLAAGPLEEILNDPPTGYSLHTITSSPDTRIDGTVYTIIWERNKEQPSPLR